MFAICLVIAVLTILDISKVNVAIPSINTSLGADPVALQLIVAGYTLTFGLVLVPAGRYGDLNSRRRMFLIGLTLFTVASLACTISPTPDLLVVSRLLQGVAAGILMPQVMGLIQQEFQGAERGKAFGIFGAVVGISVAFGPALGGLLITLGGDEWGWRLVFLMNVPLALIVLPLAIRMLPRTQPRSTGPRDLDPLGTLLLGLATIALMLPFVLTTGTDRDDPARWWLIAGAALLTAAFILWERRYAARGRVPVIDLSLFKIPSFRNGSLIATFQIAGVPPVFLVLALFLQQGLGLEPLLSGIVTMFFALLSGPASMIAGPRALRIGRPLIVVGLLIMFLGFGGMTAAALTLPGELAPWFMALGIGVAGIGGGFITAANQTLTLEHVPVESGGLAGSIGQLGQRLGTAVGVAIATSAFYATLRVERDIVGDYTAFHDALRTSVVIVSGFLVVALVIAIVDYIQHRVRPERIGEGASEPDPVPVADPA